MAFSMVVHLLILHLILNFSEGRRIDRPSQIPETPQIWPVALSEVDSYEELPVEEEFRKQSHFQNDFISKNGTDYVVFDGIRDIMFMCRSRYPVIWSLPHLQAENMYHYSFTTIEKRFSTFDVNQGNPVNKYFESVLSVHLTLLNFFNSNITCSVGDDGQHLSSKASSIHVFYTGKIAIENQGKTINVYVPPTKKNDTSGETVTFPCKPANPSTKILLEKQVEYKNNPSTDNSTKKWVKFKVPSTFDPKIGFTLLKDTVGRRDYIFGLYRCIPMEEGEQQENNDDEYDSQVDIQGNFVFINVTSNKSQDNVPNEDTKLESTLQLKDNASVAYGQNVFGKYPPTANFTDADSVLLCCTGVSLHSPIMYAEKCEDPLGCQLLKLAMSRSVKKRNGSGWYEINQRLREDRNDCSRLYLDSGNIVICQAETIEFIEHFVAVFAEGIMPVANRSRRGTGNGTVLPLTKYETIKNAKKVDLSQKIFLTIAHPITSLELSRMNYDFRFNKVTFYLTKNDNYGNDYIDYDEYNAELTRGAGEIQLRREERFSDKITEYSRDHFYEMEPLVMVCLGWRYMYVDGAHLSISWENGTTTVVEQRERESEIRSETLYFSLGVDLRNIYESDNSLVHKFGREVLASKEMRSIECWMPQSNSSGWDKLSRNLTVLDSYPPQFSKGEGNVNEEMVYLYLGDEPGNKLECRIVGGAPEPKITVIKDGKSILDWRHDGIPIPRFHRDRNKFAGMLNATVLREKSEKDKNDSASVIKIQITFSQVTHEQQGVYQCKAENVRGTVTRTFRVVVVEKRNAFLPIVFTSMIISGLLLIGMGIRHWRQQKNVQLLRSNMIRQ